MLWRVAKCEGKTMSIVRASSKYQIAIPKAIRTKLNIKPGQKLSITESEGSMLVTPVPEDPVKYLCGILAGEPSMTAELLKERKRDLKHE
jgi:AbrB family looped-hinge helix DNA binding protein